MINPRFLMIILILCQTYVEKTCHEEFGHLVLMGIFDTVDDTKLVGKAILGEITENFKKVIAFFLASCLLAPCSLLLAPCSLLPSSCILVSLPQACI